MGLVTIIKEDMTQLHDAITSGTNRLSLKFQRSAHCTLGVQGGQIFGFAQLLVIFRENAQVKIRVRWCVLHS